MSENIITSSSEDRQLALQEIVNLIESGERNIVFNMSLNKALINDLFNTGLTVNVGDEHRAQITATTDDNNVTRYPFMSRVVAKGDEFIVELRYMPDGYAWDNDLAFEMDVDGGSIGGLIELIDVDVRRLAYLLTARERIESAKRYLMIAANAHVSFRDRRDPAMAYTREGMASAALFTLIAIFDYNETPPFPALDAQKFRADFDDQKAYATYRDLRNTYLAHFKPSDKQRMVSIHAFRMLDNTRNSGQGWGWLSNSLPFIFGEREITELTGLLRDAGRYIEEELTIEREKVADSLVEEN